jgi:methylphosphotriester-DNA--protein-cysteine methyltransferase
MSVSGNILKILALLLLSVSLKAQTVYKTPSGAKYHLADCRMVKNVSEQITVAEARESGLQPCKICKPVNIYSSTTTSNKAQGQGTSSQCKGMTKSGTRCRHMTRIANGYCFQHQPG